MPDAFDELLDRLERLTNAILKASTGPERCSIEDLAAPLEERSALVRQVSERLVATAPVSYKDYKRLVVVHSQGAQIATNLRKIRNDIAAELSCGARDRLYADRLAGQLSPIT